MGDAHGGRGGDGFVAAEVAREARVGTAGDLDADAVPGAKGLGRRPERDGNRSDVVGWGWPALGRHALDAVAHVGGATVGVDVTKSDEHVVVFEVGGHVDLGADLADDLDVSGEDLAGEHEHIVALLCVGLVAATVSPYVVAAIGPRRARGLFGTGRVFDADEALRIGLVDEVVDGASGLTEAKARLSREIMACAPKPWTRPSGWWSMLPTARSIIR